MVYLVAVRSAAARMTSELDLSANVFWCAAGNQDWMTSENREV
jgi:hypothetical protein